MAIAPFSCQQSVHIRPKCPNGSAPGAHTRSEQPHDPGSPDARDDFVKSVGAQLIRHEGVRPAIKDVALA